MKPDILFENFDLLAEAPDSVPKLREMILQLAVQGKLVPQNMKDEPASELLKKVKKEKKKLVAEGKLKKQKPLPPFSKDDVPYKLPKGWKWSRLGFVTSYGLCEKLTPQNIKNNVWILELEDIEKVSSKLIKKIRCPQRNPKSTKSVFKKDSVLYGKLRPYLDKVIVAACIDKRSGSH